MYRQRGASAARPQLCLHMYRRLYGHLWRLADRHLYGPVSGNNRARAYFGHLRMCVRAASLHAGVWACMHVCIHGCVHACLIACMQGCTTAHGTDTWTHGHTDARTHRCKVVWTHTYMHTSMHRWTDDQAHGWVKLHTLTDERTDVKTDGWTRTYTPVHTRTYAFTCTHVQSMGRRWGRGCHRLR